MCVVVAAVGAVVVTHVSQSGLFVNRVGLGENSPNGTLAPRLILCVFPFFLSLLVCIIIIIIIIIISSSIPSIAMTIGSTPVCIMDDPCQGLGAP